MGKLVKPKKLVGGRKRVNKRRMLPAEKVRHKKAMAEIRPHYTKTVRVLADEDADYPDRQYYFKQIYSPDDVKNPLKGIWDRANHLRALGYDLGKPTLVAMSPQEFLDLNPTPTHKEYSDAKMKLIREAWKSGEWEPLSMISEGPFMDVDSTGRVTGHEGRHRAMLLKELGHKEMPVLIYTRHKRDEDWRIQEPWMFDEVKRLSERKRIQRELERNRRRLGMPEFEQKRRNK